MDAFKLSRNDQMGTARGIAMGGALGALGAEITGVAQNPAGIGVYRSSEVVTTMDFMSNKIETNTEGYKANESKFKFAFDNVAYVGYMPLSGDVFKSFNFGLAYNRLKNFDRNYSMKGSVLPHSFTDYIANISNPIIRNGEIIDSYPFDEFEFGNRYDDPYRIDGLPWLGILGYNANIIKNIPGGYDDEYESAWDGTHEVDNGLQVSERGHIESFDFTAGTNISNMLYLGLTFSITDIYYNINANYSEDFFLANDKPSGYFDLDNWKETTGSGYQVSVGAIFKPIDELRLGIAYHSPTWYHMRDVRNCYLDVLLPDESRRKGNAPEYDDVAPFDYRLQTPDRWVVSAAGILGAKAIVSVDYEYTNFSNMKLKNNYGYDFSDNEYIKEDFKGASTLKTGIEYRVTPQLSIRAGYCWSQSPLEKTFKEGKREAVLALNSTMPHFTLEGNASTFSCGLGYKFTPKFYMDLAFSARTQTDDLYTFSNIPDEIEAIPSKFKNNTCRGLLTFGYKF